MHNISEKLISVEEAETALRCMRLSGLSEKEALESLDEFAFRIRDITMSKVVENIIEKELTELQRRVIKLYLYDGMNTVAIGRELNVSQANIHGTLSRANETIMRLMTPLIEYQNDILSAREVPLRVGELEEICAARNSNAREFCTRLRNLRLSFALDEKKLAANLKITQRELSDIETGRKMPSLTTAMRYSALFGAEIEMNFKNGKGVYLCRKP